MGTAPETRPSPHMADYGDDQRVDRQKALRSTWVKVKLSSGESPTTVGGDLRIYALRSVAHPSDLGADRELGRAATYQPTRSATSGRALPVTAVAKPSETAAFPGADRSEYRFAS